MPAALLVVGSIIVRTVTQVLLLASLSIGLCFIPEVNARVPETRAVAAAATEWLQVAANEWGIRLPGNQAATPAYQAQALPVARQQRSAPQQFVATQAVLIDSTPRGAIVRLGTRTVGKTPLTLRVAPGTYTVTISRPGFATITRTIAVKTGKAASLGVILKAATVLPVQSTMGPQQQNRTQENNNKQEQHQVP